MKSTRYFVLFLAAIVGTSMLVAETPSPVVEAPVNDFELVADPFLGLSDITSSGPQAGGFCICVPGLNCCGDLPNRNDCSLPFFNCYCNAARECKA